MYMEQEHQQEAPHYSEPSYYLTPSIAPELVSVTGVSDSTGYLYPAVWRIHAGGVGYADKTANFWSGDGYYQGGGINGVDDSQAISNTDDPGLYRTERWGDFTYTLFVPPGNYQVTLKFAELFSPPSLLQRIMDISINGEAVLSNFNIAAEAGGQFIALDKTLDNISPDVQGRIAIHFKVTASSDDPNAKVSAILVTPQPPAPVPPASFVAPVLRTSLQFSPDLAGDWDSNRGTAVLRYGWKSVGELIPTPSTAFDGTQPALTAVTPALFPKGDGGTVEVEVEDASGAGLSAQGHPSADGTQFTLSGLDTPLSPALKAPLKVYFDLLKVSRGKTVPSEILGSGDATQVNQEFVLKNSPLTYLLSSEPVLGHNYRSTLTVWVDGLSWKEEASFYGQGADAQVFVTEEDEQGKTHVKFGDGVNGARLSSGANNVTASYRYGAGQDAPDAGQLTVILKAQPGLKSIRNPVAVGGGSDADSPDHIRRYAPASVLTLGRAVSAEDYEALAAQTPGVSRASAKWLWDDAKQRTLVKVFVGDDESARAAAALALAGADDPNRPVDVVLAQPVPAALDINLLLKPRYEASMVTDAVTQVLVDPDNGLLGVNSVGIGQGFYESQINEVCLSVPGVEAVLDLKFYMDQGAGAVQAAPPYFDPGAGKFLQMPKANLTLSTQADDHE